jgi:glutamyl-tRNA synthetase
LAAIDDWSEQSTQAVVERVAANRGVGMGAVAQPLRVALTGDTVSPGIGVTLSILGRDQTLARLDRALQRLQDATPPG